MLVCNIKFRAGGILVNMIKLKERDAGLLDQIGVKDASLLRLDLEERQCWSIRSNLK